MSTQEAHITVTTDLLGFNLSVPPFTFIHYTGQDICNGTGMSTAEWAARNAQPVNAALVLGQNYGALLHLPTGPDGNSYVPVGIAGIEKNESGSWHSVPLSVQGVSGGPYGGGHGGVWMLRALNPAVTDSNAPLSSMTVLAWPGWGPPAYQDGSGDGAYYVLPYTGATLEPYLRIRQRNDGAGPSRHPRLRESRSAPSSVQSGAAPRVARTNRYR